MRLLAFILLFLSVGAYGQTTPNPPIKKKSTNDTFVNKIEITEDYTIFSMQFVSKNAEEQLKDYFDNNPKEKKEISQLPSMMRNMYLQQMLEGIRKNGGSTISIQPTSFLRAPNGEKFKFIKATNIPIAPERQTVEVDKKYFFKVYFEKLSPGIQSVDLVESENREEDGMTYWNFYGIKVNNPANGEESLAFEEQETETKVVLEKMITVKGNVLDFDSQEPIQAKILCKTGENETLYDSVITSKTGYFEFYLPNTTTTYVVSAAGYDAHEQSLDLSRKAEKEIEYDIYLEKPFKIEKPAEIKAVDLVKEEVEGQETELEEKEELEVLDNNKLRLNHLYFETGKDEILVKSHAELDKLLKLLQDKPKMRIRVEGHTDNQGDSRKNKVLSLDRAMAVRNYLVGKGIAADRIEFTGYGDTKPIVENADDLLRQKNRRVEIVILED
ncbi:Outer membrane protein OmpA [Spirosomataceae bacterium TFI 002]|nr:Outer membrane protein OmpA [Spirosomataceae bacterium TFI 002]